MAISIRQTITATTSGSNATVNLGSGTAIGDLLVAVAYTNFFQIANWGGPNGGGWHLWRSQDLGTDNAKIRIWTRRVTVAGTQSVTIPHIGGEEPAVGVYVITGANLDNPIEDITGVNSTTPTGNPVTHPVPSVTAESSSGLLINAVASATFATGNNWVPPGGMTEAWDFSTSPAANRYASGYEVLSSSGATGTRNWTHNTNNGDAALVSFIVRPAEHDAPAVPLPKAVGTVASGTGSITPALPANTTAGDILLAFGECNGGESFTVPSGWAHVPGSPVTPSGNATRLTVLWRRATGSDSAPAMGDPGDHGVARVLSISGVVQDGDPWDATPTTSTETTSNSSAEWPSITTATDNALIVQAIATGRDSATTANLSPNAANSTFDGVSEQIDDWVSAGGGGGIGVITGRKPTAGSTGQTTATMGSNDAKALITIALKPRPAEAEPEEKEAATSLSLAVTSAQTAEKSGAASGSLWFHSTLLATPLEAKAATAELSLGVATDGDTEKAALATSGLSLAASQSVVAAKGGLAETDFRSVLIVSGAAEKEEVEEKTASTSLSLAVVTSDTAEKAGQASTATSLGLSAPAEADKAGVAAGDLTLAVAQAGVAEKSLAAEADLELALGQSSTAEKAGEAASDLSLAATVGENDATKAGEAAGDLGLALVAPSDGTKDASAAGSLVLDTGLGDSEAAKSSAAVASLELDAGFDLPATKDAASEAALQLTVEQSGDAEKAGETASTVSLEAAATGAGSRSAASDANLALNIEFDGISDSAEIHTATTSLGIVSSIAATAAKAGVSEANLDLETGLEGSELEKTASADADLALEVEFGASGSQNRVATTSLTLETAFGTAEAAKIGSSGTDLTLQVENSALAAKIGLAEVDFDLDISQDGVSDFRTASRTIFVELGLGLAGLATGAEDPIYLFEDTTAEALESERTLVAAGPERELLSEGASTLEVIATETTVEALDS